MAWELQQRGPQEALPSSPPLLRREVQLLLPKGHNKANLQSFEGLLQRKGMARAAEAKGVGNKGASY